MFPSPYPGDKSLPFPGITLELLQVPRVRSAGNQGLIRKHPSECHQVALAQTSALEAPQQHKSGVNEQLCKVVRARHVLKPSLRRDSVGVGGGRLCCDEHRWRGCDAMGRDGSGWVGWVWCRHDTHSSFVGIAKFYIYFLVLLWKAGCNSGWGDGGGRPKQLQYEAVKRNTEH